MHALCYVYRGQCLAHVDRSNAGQHIRGREMSVQLSLLVFGMNLNTASLVIANLRFKRDFRILFFDRLSWPLFHAQA